MKVIQCKYANAFKKWFELLGYEVKSMKGKGFIAKSNNRDIKKRHQYVLVTSNLGGNQAAIELGREFEIYAMDTKVV